MQKNKSLPRLSAAMAAAALASALSDGAVRADAFFDQIGLTQLRAEQPLLTGTGVIVAQPEATTVDDNGFDHDNYQVSAASSGVTATISYVGTGGTTQSFSAIQDSGHANLVAQYLAGSTLGVAPGIARLLNINANWYGNAYILPNNAITPLAPKILNQSFSESPSGPFTAAVLDQVWDTYAAARNVIIVTAAGNGGGIIQPGTAYNVISVGVYPGGFSSVSSPGDRSKPDIVAPSRQPSDNFSSFTTPVVSGAAALLVQAAGGSGTGTDARVVKSLLLNGAVKPADWTHSSAVPLDRQYGAGVVNVYNSYKNLTAGQHTASSTTLTASIDGAHAPINPSSSVGIAGWNLGTITSNSGADAVDHYVIDLSTASTLTTLTTTLDWMRAADAALTTEVRNSNASTSTFTSAINTINNLDLFLYNVNGGTLTDLSVSAIDNVEHLYTVNLAPGKYDVEVLKHGGATGTANVFSNGETYGLAWNVGTQSTATNAGTIVFNQTNSVAISTAISGIGGITKGGTGTTTLTAYSGTGAIVVNSGKLVFGATTAIRGTPAVLVTTSALTVNSTLDLSNRDLLVHNGNTSALEAKLATAFNFGLWTGSGITSSAASADNRTLLGIISGADFNNLFGGQVDGITLASTDTLIKYTYAGDINLDGVVDDNDLFQFLPSYLGSKKGDYAQGDINYDGVVDDNDLFAFLANYLNPPSQRLGDLSPSFAALQAGSSPVPEPGSLLLLTMAAAALVVRAPRPRYRVKFV